MARTNLSETFWFDLNEDGQQTADELKSTSYQWTYDDIGRLTDEVINHWDDSIDQTERFKYDLAGNRLELRRDLGNDNLVDHVISYDFDANDRLIEELFDDKTAVSVR